VSPEEFENAKDKSAAMVAKGFKRMFQMHPKFKEIWRASTLKRND